MSKAMSMSLLGEELLKAGAGAEAKLSCFVVCTGKKPLSLQEIEEHLQTCSSCRMEVAKYLKDVEGGKYINETGWWDPCRKGPYFLD